MGKMLEIDTEYGRVSYTVSEDGVMLTEYKGRDLALEIPGRVDGKPVTTIGKKAFLGMKGLQELILPEDIAVIQDWAFASCSGLQTVVLPRRKLIIGQGVFKDCLRLQRIIPTGGDAALEEDTSFLLAAAMNKLDAFYLFDPAAAGGREWLMQWDARMLSLIGREDAEGFSKMLLCGEEDYGSRENNLDYYIEQKRRFKVRLAMLRLMHGIGLSPDVKDMLLSYLQAHKKGESSEETWKVVLEEHGDDRQYYQFLLDCGCITEENFDAVLEDMGEKHTEMKALLMNYQGARQKKEDAFAGLAFEL